MGRRWYRPALGGHRDHGRAGEPWLTFAGVQLGIVVPQNELPDPTGVVAVAEAAAAAGFAHVLLYDHVLGAERGGGRELSGPYDVDDPFHEVMVMLGHLAGHVALELWTGVLILPQRQAALVAKQAAQVDVLCGGRLRLGVGVGWNPVEYEALGEGWHDRGTRYEEQVALMRALWTERVVTFRGRFHTVERAGILPMPLQRPIPLWMGGLTSGRVLERIGRLSDGWISFVAPGHGLEEAWAQVQAAASAAGRALDAVGLHGIIQPGADASHGRVRDQAARWERAGATHLSVSGLGGGRSPAEHVDFVRVVAEALLG